MAGGSARDGQQRERELHLLTPLVHYFYLVLVVPTILSLNVYPMLTIQFMCFAILFYISCFLHGAAFVKCEALRVDIYVDQYCLYVEL